MRDYGSVAKSLRCCISDSEPCEHCNCELEECTPKIIMEIAADAIEELLEEKAKLEKSCKLLVAAFARLKEKVPKWISVEERLPKKDEMVIVYYSWIGQSGTEYKEVSLATLEEIRYCGSKLLGWMPLPEPPKKVE